MSAALAAEALPEAQLRAVVHKFGGSSLADAACIRRAAAIVAQESASTCYVVVSAAAGVTNALLDCLQTAATGEDWRHDCRRLQRRQLGLITMLDSEATAAALRIGLSEDFRRLRCVFAAAAILRSASPETADAVAAHGELWSTRLFTAVLRGQKIQATALDARRFLRARKSGDDVTVDWAASHTCFVSLSEPDTGGVIVVPGFVASCADRGITLTLGRDGSDWSATILARLARVSEVTIWSDVPGVLDGDPAIIAEAATQTRLGFAAARQLAEHGARVLHPATLEPLAGLGVKLRVKSSFDAQGGTTQLDEQAPSPAVMVSARNDTVSAIGAGMQAALAFAALAGAGLNPRAGDIAPDRVSVSVAPSDVVRAQRIWHRRLCRQQRRLDWVLIGAGRVGQALLAAIATHDDDTLRLLALADSKRCVRRPEGIAPGRARQRLRRAPKSVNDPAALGEFLRAHCEATPVIVDATASAAIARWHARWLAAGTHVVTANKLAAAAGWITPAHRERADYGDSATVGAGLPILAMLRRLRASGDRIERVEAVLSGSLAFLFGALERGRSFNATLAAARRAGWLEPDPRSDLAGLDVARKLAIIADAAGIEATIAEPQPALSVEWMPSAFETSSGKSSAGLEFDLRRTVRAAHAQGRVLRYVAGLAADGENYIGPRAVPRDSLLAQTQGVENIVAVYSRCCGNSPLVVRGPGAGPQLTARALLADLAAIRERHG